MNKKISSFALVIIVLIALIFSSGKSIAQHNHGENKNTDTTISNNLTDPVCKMQVSKNDSLSVEYNSRIYYFCSEKDMKIFLKSPQKYIKQDNSEQKEEHNHGMMGMSPTMIIIMGSVMVVMMIAGMVFLRK